MKRFLLIPFTFVLLLLLGACVVTPLGYFLGPDGGLVFQGDAEGCVPPDATTSLEEGGPSDAGSGFEVGSLVDASDAAGSNEVPFWDGGYPIPNRPPGQPVAYATVFLGNSIWGGTLVVTNNPLTRFGVDYLADRSHGNVYNLGVGGSSCGEMVARVSILTTGGAGVANRLWIVECGLNDAYRGLTYTQSWAAITAISNAIRALGPGNRIALVPPHDRTPAVAGYNTLLGQTRDYIRAHWAEVADDIIDIVADPVFGAPGASTDLSYFVDGTHWQTHGYARFVTLHLDPAMDRAANAFYAASHVP